MASSLGRVAVVFDSGGFNGLRSVGPAKAIWSRDIQPVALFGTSVGAINAAKIAESNSVDSVRELEGIWLRIGKFGPEAIFNSHGITLRLVKSKPSLYLNDKLTKLIDGLDVKKIVAQQALLGIIVRNETRNNFPDGDLLCSNVLEFLSHRFQIVSNRDGEIAAKPELLRQYIIASASVPGAFDRVTIQNQNFSDGFVFASAFHRISILNCDTIFLILNKNSPVTRTPPWYQAMFGGLRSLQDVINGIAIASFLQTHQDFSVYHMSKELKLLRRASERHFVIIEPPNSVPDLGQVRFKKVDFPAVIKEGFTQTNSLLSILEH